MTKKELQSFYDQRRIEFSAQVGRLSKKINLVSNTRLITAAAIVATIYFGFSNTTLLYLLLVWIGVFFALIKKHSQLFDTRTHLENLVRVNASELKGLTGDYSDFGTGAAFMNPHHPYSYDLDVFGEGSLFQIINRSNTRSGIQKFSRRLTNPLDNKAEIEEQQQAIREVGSKTDFRQHFQAAGLEIDEQSKDRQQLLDWIAQPNFLFGKSAYRVLLIVVPIVTVGLVVGWIYSDVFRPFAILLAAFQWAFLGFHLKRVNEFHDFISRKKNILLKYDHLLMQLQKETFSSSFMQLQHKRSQDAGRKVKQLAKLVQALDARLNSMTSIFVNSLLLYDLQCVYRLEKWKSENAHNLVSWLEAVSDAEVVCSFGTFAFNHAHFTYPSISDSLTLSACEMGHPIIPEEECVPNDFYIGDKPSIAIVTGANMAGKSTFLRSIGVNVILALNGAPVFAKSFQCPLINLRTGMRTADSLKDHQSYFYAELDRLKGIMDDLRNDIPILVLLDEILKGTNSTDKQTGSIALVKQLIPHPCLAVIATHDLALGDLENEFPEKVKNFCFEANIENDQLSFDYKLKRGLAQKMNATFLMKKMGIIPR